MRRVGKGFSGVETPLFESMLAVRDVPEEAEAQVPAQGVDVQEHVVEEVATEVVPPTPTSPSPSSPYIKRYHGIKKKPQTESEAHKNMISYLKNTEGYKMEFFKGKTYDEILPIFQANFDANMKFLFKSKEEMEKEDEEIIKSINETPTQKAAKRRKLSEEAQEADDLKKRFFTTLLKNFDREDLETLWRIVRDRFSTSKPTNFSDEYLLLTLKTMFGEIDRQDAIWRNQKSIHGLALVKRWKLLTSCGVHVIILSIVQLFLLFERRVDAVEKIKEEHQKSTKSKGFEQNVDFLNANPIKYALTVNPTIYSSCIQQFWYSVKVKTVNEDVHIRALVDGNKIIITEASIRRNLQLQDAEGTACLPNAAIFEELARMDNTMASAIICLANNQKFNISKYILDNMVKNLEARVKFYMFLRFVQVFVNNQLGDMSHYKVIFVNPSLTKKRKHKSRMKQRKKTKVSQDEPQTEEHIPTPSHDPLPSGQIKTNQAAEIKKLKKIVKKLEGKKNKRTHGLKRLYKFRLSARVESSKEEAGLDQGRINDQDMFRVNYLNGNEVGVHASAGEKEEQSEKVTKKEVSTIDPVTTTGEVVTTADVEVSDALTTTTTTDDDVTVAQTLIEIKASKPKAATTVTVVSTRPKEKGFIMQEPSETPSPKLIVSFQQPSHSKDKGKAKMVEPKRLLKKKEQIKKEEEANIAMIAEWDNIQAMMDADCELAAKLQEEERGEPEERRRKPPTKAQKRKQMCTYLKNMAGFTHNQLKSKSFKEVQQAFNKTIDWVNNFVAMDLEEVEGSNKTQAKVIKGGSKRAGNEIEQESAKRQRLEKEDDTVELKRCLEIVLKDDVAIKATPLSSKSPTIVDYKIYREGKKSYFKIIRADGNSQNYLTFRKMFKNFNKEDLEVLWSIVKTRFKKTKPVDDMDNLLFQTLKTMFEHHVKDNIWKYQQGAVKFHN
nr:hypothetical protein [Tanacetum cinerariifolium]